MKKLLLVLGLVLSLVSCTESYEKIYCKWEILYPDTTIVYEDTMTYIYNHCYPGERVCRISSERGSNFINVEGMSFAPGALKYPISSTCPMRLISYKFIN